LIEDEFESIEPVLRSATSLMVPVVVLAERRPWVP
jgi:hypothetical protein